MRLAKWWRKRNLHFHEQWNRNLVTKLNSILNDWCLVGVYISISDISIKTLRIAIVIHHQVDQQCDIFGQKPSSNINYFVRLTHWNDGEEEAQQLKPYFCIDFPTTTKKHEIRNGTKFLTRITHMKRLYIM